jgi:hypothetical protein
VSACELRGPFGPGGQRLVLVEDQAVCLNDAPGTTVSCERGSVWITQHRDGRDVVLATGQSFNVSRSGTTLLVAMDARTVVTISGPAPVRKSWLQSLLPASGRPNATNKGVMS